MSKFRGGEPSAESTRTVLDRSFADRSSVASAGGATLKPTSSPRQLNIFHQPVSPQRGDGSGAETVESMTPDSRSDDQTPRIYQLDELPGETWADIFGDAA